MSEQFGSNTSNSLLITIPSRGEKDWDQDIRNLCFSPISTHDHTGSGNGAKISTAALEDECVTAEKLPNNVVSSAKLSSSSSVDSERAVDSDHIKDDAIISRHISDNAINTAAMITDAVVGLGLIKSGGTNIRAHVDDSSIEIGGAGLQVKQDGIVTAMIANDNVSQPKLSAALRQRLDDIEADIQTIATHLGIQL